MAIRRNADLPPRLLRTQEAAHFLGLSVRTLEKHRTYGTGPTYRKIGGSVLYTVHDLDAWSAIGDPDLETEDDLLEEGGDDEETLGWSALCSQICLGPNTADGDESAPERHGEGFVRGEPDDYEDEE